MRKVAAFFLFIVLISFSSCFKEDKPIVYVPLDGITNTAHTGSDYSMVAYFDLETNTFVGSNHRERWDLAFDNIASNDWNVLMNGGKKMRILALNTEDISESTPTPSAASPDWLHDDYDKSPICGWDIRTQSAKRSKVHIVDLGTDVSGFPLGYKKIRMLPSAHDVYTFETANLDGSNIQTFSTQKDPQYNFQFFSFENGGEWRLIEPLKNTFDFVFCQYTDKSYYAGSTTEFEWYSVNGTLFNHSAQIACAIDSSGIDFESVLIDQISNYTFSDKKNALGYAWKQFDFDEQIYKVKNWIYIIKDRKGDYYKLQFLSFVNPQGEKGYPTFRISRL